MVSGLVYSVVSSATGRLTRNSTATMPAPSICSGPGISPQNMPAATPPAAERRFRCQSDGWKRASPNRCSARTWRTFSTLGM
jgi:hypothetical protein